MTCDSGYAPPSLVVEKGGPPAIHDLDAINSAQMCRLTGAQFGDHAGTCLSFSNQVDEALVVDERNRPTFWIEHPGRRSRNNQLPRSNPWCEISRKRVGVHVEQMSDGVASDTGYDRHIAVSDEVTDECRCVIAFG